MGPELVGKLVVISEDGKKTEFENAIINEIKAIPNEVKLDDTLEDCKSTTVKDYNYEFSIDLGRMTRKRFIKLLMAKGFQRNQAKRMHQEYIRKYKYRTQLNLEIFTSIYDFKVGEIKVFVGGKEVNIKYEKDNTKKDSFNFKVVREVKNE